jgi:predicted house-cleaning noncanonical NTP pyrophosphatase (MazG superfamily)
VYEKLIRDLIPHLARAEGRELLVRAAGEAELGPLLSRKLVEEAPEVADALASGERAALLEELWGPVYRAGHLGRSPWHRPGRGPGSCPAQASHQQLFAQ